MKKADIYVYSAINSIKSTKGYGGIILVSKKTDGTDGTMSFLCEMENATRVTSEIMLITYALSRFKEPCRITVHINEVQTMTTIKVWMPPWKQRGWLNSSGKPVDEWYRELDRYMEGHELTFTAEKGEYGSWLETNTRKAHEEGERSCLISLENLTASKN